MAATELEPADNERAVVPHVDTADVPSAAWGWSGESPKTFRIAGWFVALALLAMLIGNHNGKVEDIFLVAFALSIAGLFIYDIIYRRRPR
ncbi:DUF2631 domain-containing protein [Nocardia sp. NPDC050697]|uniref:DUF2631 domain-containing protein n=1 Tax=Nocardia sp. NPDC050697 TaxID=3155158 RepID=UPI0033F4E8E9